VLRQEPPGHFVEHLATSRDGEEGRDDEPAGKRWWWGWLADAEWEMSAEPVAGGGARHCGHGRRWGM
jgi:hypothetical protein